jgi:transcription-repair coupling factor (superfamily II helicase)
MLAQRIGVAGIDRKQNIVHLRFTENAAVDPGRLMQFVADTKGAHFSPGGTLKFVLRSTAAEDVLRQIRELLFELYAEQPVKTA